ncbi:MAG: RDD family protein [Paraperlucidibaca sp.]
MNTVIENTLDEATEYGGFWRRFAALFIDFITMVLPILLISTVFRIVIFLVIDADLNMLNMADSVLTIVLWWLYFACLHASPWQASLGKRVLGLKVVDLNGNRISFSRATGRFFAEYLSALTLCIGYMMAGWTKRKQSLHDMVAKTYVIKSKA